ncbi:MAG: M23 family metallopeptidase, partial [Spongiibacteraceae bacterium]
GTPVYAAGDGRVMKAGYSKANGNYVFLKHGESYVTKYLHLHKRAVAQGARVRQREVIGWVGSTGYATGPHLHYEFLVNGVHRNPATIVKKLPPPKRVSKSVMPDFKAQISGLRLQMRTYAAQRNYTSDDAG